MREEAGFRFQVSRFNWSLWIGGVVVLLVVVVALAGPELAPKDPLERLKIVKVGDEWTYPASNLFGIPGLSLGIDYAQRDLLSRLLWGVRPTMTMVVIVAGVRLALGIVIGLSAGWFTGWLRRVLDTLMAAALSVPVLIVALGAIAAVGVDMGVSAFIIGLSINGWVETARQVRAQTVLVKGNLYVEAARALGASDSQVLLRHVLRQIMPMVWMLFAFEISGTLMVTAVLGYLGYYIGGDVWVRVSDRSATAVSGIPELGQMLATTPASVLYPEAMVIMGSVIVVVVLGFNLLGQGLRGRLSLAQRPKETAVSRAVGRALAWTADVSYGAREWADERLWSPLLARKKFLYPALGGALLLTVGGLVGWRLQAQKQEAVTPLESTLPGGHLWAAERHDAQGTLCSHATGSVTPEIQWTFSDPAGLAGGPVVSRDGTVFVASQGGTLYALTFQGDVRWQVSLPAAAVGTPALSARGQVYVADEAGGLSAFAPDGALRWRLRAEAGDFSTSGPVVAQDGSVYYVIKGGAVQAVSPEGVALWKKRIRSSPTYAPPRLSPDGEWLFLEDVVVSARDGSPGRFEMPGQVHQYLVGADGQTYFLSGHTVTGWRPGASGVETLQSTTWKDYKKFTAGVPRASDAGVTHEGLVWLLYSGKVSSVFGAFEDARLVWLSASGEARGNVLYPHPESQVIAVAGDATTYVCGLRRQGGRGVGGAECLALKPGADQPLWSVALEGGGKVQGGALTPGRLYVTVDEGILYAIGEGQPLEVVVQETGPVEEPIETLGPASGEISWVFEDATGFSNGPAVSDDGTVVISSQGATLYALDPAGNTLWEASLPAAPAGSPTLNEVGEIFVSDKGGSLSAFAPDGRLLWRFQPPESKPSTVAPLVAPGGTIYYTVGSRMQAVSSAGEGLWQTRYRTFRTHTPLQLNPDGEWLFFAEDVFDTRDGAIVELESPVKVDRYIIGNDGQTYLRVEHTVMQWQASGPTSIEIVQSAEWNYSEFSFYGSPPLDAGVTRQHVIWVIYSVEYGTETRVAWLDVEGRVLGTVEYPFGGGQVLAVGDGDNTAYICGVHDPRSKPSPECVAFEPGGTEPVWQVAFEEGEEVTGGALGPQRLYVSTRQGRLYAIGEGQALEQAARPTPTDVPEETPVSVALPTPTLMRPVVSAGGTLTFTLNATNNGPSDASGVIVTDTLPAGVTFVGVMGCQAGQVANGSAERSTESSRQRLVVCDLGDLPSGASATITIVVTVDPLATGVMTHTATVAAGATDPDTSDNSVEREIQVK